jgi:ferritin-like metal-binding protein YciE
MHEEHSKKLVEWLTTAHALETKIIEILGYHEDDAEEYIDIQGKIREHKEISKKHAQMVEDCLQRLGEDTSKIKEASSKVTGNIVGLSSDFMKDKVYANALAEYATENTEIFLYRTIKEAAKKLDHGDITSMCDKIISEEEEMAKWLENNIPKLVDRVIKSE